MHTPAHKYAGSITPARTLDDQLQRHRSKDGDKVSFDEWFELEYTSVKHTMSSIDYYALRQNLRRAWAASRKYL